MDAAILAEKLREALDNYTSYNGQNLNPVIIYMRQAESHLRRNDSNKELENLVAICRRKIVENNRGLVVSITRSYCSPSYEYYDDFFSEGMIGLLNAIPKYNPKKGKFSGYAGTAIRLNINRRMREITGNIRLPINFPCHQRNIEYFLESFKKKYKRIPTDKELAEFSGKYVSEIKSLRRNRTLSHTSSLNASIYNKDEEAGCLLDYFIDNRNCSMEEEIINRIIYQELINCIKKLPDRRERNILIERLEGKTLEELGIQENLTRERIRQIQKKAVKKLKEMKEFKRLILK